jgi:ABC-type multidrug transport system fused ATPase/permease subunit
VERLDKYAKIDQEAARILPDDPDKGWPINGAISVKDLEVCYATGDRKPVISELSFVIQPKEKIGIVGRTGSGKSTLVIALFRILEATKGTILIDGLNIMKMGLKSLRKGMQIISQEPILFTGTFRSNLDIEQQYEDSEIWHALEMVGLKTYVSELGSKLDSPITENGDNLSVGQRQL